MIINGSIVDRNTGDVLQNCTIAKYSDNELVSDPIQVKNGNFSIDVSTDPNTYFIFNCPGYAMLKATTSEIISFGGSNYNAFLTPVTANMGEKILPVAAGLVLVLMTQRKNKSVGKLETKDVFPYLLIGGALVVSGILKKILTGLGVYTSADTTALDHAATDPGSFWNPTYYKNFTSYTYSIDRAGANNLVEQITDAFGAFNDCEECVIAVFRQLKTKSEVSYLADVFYQNTGNDLLTYLRGGSWPEDRLSDTDVNTINEFVSKLPTN